MLDRASGRSTSRTAWILGRSRRLRESSSVRRHWRGARISNRRERLRKRKRHRSRGGFLCRLRPLWAVVEQSKERAIHASHAPLVADLGPIRPPAGRLPAPITEWSGMPAANEQGRRPWRPSHSGRAKSRILGLLRVCETSVNKALKNLISVERDFARQASSAREGTTEKRIGGGDFSLGAQQKISPFFPPCRRRGRDRPAALDLDVGLVDAPTQRAKRFHRFSNSGT